MITALLLRIFAFLTAIFILVLIHELCHFWVARILGVKVLRFSIGFGKPLYKWRKKNGIEYAIAPIPLGGYVKMLDSNEGKVRDLHKKFAFDQKPVLSRAAIILAGPLGNIVFAILAFWIIFAVGIKVTKPIIGKVENGSQAFHAGLLSGDEFLSIDKEKTASWADVLLTMIKHVGEKDRLTITLLRKGKVITKNNAINLEAWQTGIAKTNPLEDIGITPYHPMPPAILGSVIPNGEAEKAGLKNKDRILSAFIARKNIEDKNEKQNINNWDDFRTYIENHPKISINLNIERENKLLQITVTPNQKFGPNWKKIGSIGVQSEPTSWPKDMLREIKYSPSEASIFAPKEVWKFFNFNINLLQKIVTGKVSLQVLGGPIMIFQSAVLALEQGLIIYLNFLAILSIALAFTNLLPIPGLDGGYLAFLAYEAITKKPISRRMQLLLFRLGVTMLLFIMVRATINDLFRIFS